MAETTTAKKPRSPRKQAPDRTPAKRASTELATLDSLIEEGRRTLSEIVALEDGPRDQYSHLARTLITMRRHFKSPGRDMPDWRGRSQEYRLAAAKIYEAAEIPPDSEGSIQTRIRYTLNNELRRVAPAKHLEELGYKKRNQAERAADRRSAKKKALDVEGPTLLAPGATPITTRTQAFLAIRSVLEGPVWEMPAPAPDDEDYAPCMESLAEACGLMAQLWALQEGRRSVRRNAIQIGSTFAATANTKPGTPSDLTSIRATARQEARFLSTPSPTLVEDLSETG